MKPPGVLVNVQAGWIRRDPDLVARLERLLPAGHLETTRSPGEIVPALVRLREADVDTLAVLGGDGTVTATLTALVRVWPDEPRPPLLLLPGGTINTIPHAVGVRGAPDRVLARLLESRVPFRSYARSVLRVYAAGGVARCGMIFGTGMVARFLETYNAARRRGPFGAAAEVARSLGSIALGGPLARKLFAPFEAHVEVDGDAVLQDRFTGLAAGAVREIGLGFRPFLSIPPSGRVGGFHWLMTDLRGFGLALELPAVRLGLAPPLSGLVHAAARTVRIRLETPQPYTNDRDLFGPAKEIHGATGPAIRLLAPAHGP